MQLFKVHLYKKIFQNVVKICDHATFIWFSKTKYSTHIHTSSLFKLVEALKWKRWRG